MVKRRFWTSKAAQLIIDSLIAGLFSLGFIRPLFFNRALEMNWPATVFSCLLAAALMAVVSLRWWIVPSLALLSLLPATYLLSRLDLLQDVIRQAYTWLNWAAQRLVLGGPEPEQEIWLIWLQLMLILLISIPVYLLVHKVTRFWVMVIPVLLAGIPFLLAYPAELPRILPGLVGLIALLPPSLIRLVRKRHLQAVLPRAPLQWLALPIAIISVLAGQLITPADTSRWRQQDWINRLYDLRDFWQNQQGISRGWQPFDLAIAGFRSVETQLGGPVRPSERVFIDVVAPESILLRGVTRSIYTGSSWQSPPHQVYRFHSPLWRLSRRQIFVEDLPSGSDGRSFFEQYAETWNIDLTPRSRLQTTLFTAGRLETLNWLEVRDYPPYFTIDGDLFVFGGLPARPEYSVNVISWQRNRQGFTDAIRILSESPQRTRDPYWHAVRNRYLQLPESLPDLIKDTASQIVGDEKDPYSQAVLLEYYFQQYDYSLDPEFPPSGMDFVEHLLLDQQGYCVHFATAMTVMARTLDLPARYVEGFALESTGNTGSNWRATGRTAHAWCEVYLQGIGWLTFDPTPAGRIEPPEEPDEPIIDPQPEPTEPVIEPTLPPSDPFQPEPEESSYVWLLLLIGLLLLAIIFRLLIVGLIRSHLRNLRLPVMHRLEPDQAACLDFTYHDILHQLHCIDVKPENGETISVFAQRANNYLRFEQVDLPDLLWPVIRLRYGNKSPTLNQLDALLELRLRLEERVRGSLTGTAWFFRRVLPALYETKKRGKNRKKPEQKDT